MTLDDLKNNKPVNLQPASIAEMGVEKSDNNTKNPINNPDNFVGKAFNDLDNLINTEKAKYEEANKAYQEEHSEDDMDKQLEEFDPDAVPTAPIPEPPVHETTTEKIAAPIKLNTTTDAPIETNIKKEMDEAEAEANPDTSTKEEKEAEAEKEFNDFFKNDDISSEDKELLDILDGKDEDNDSSDDEEEESTLTEAEEKENFRKYQEQAKDLFAKKMIDTSKFKVSRKHISMSALLQKKEPDKKIADWILPTVNKSFSMTEFSGIDIQKINPQSRQRNRINSVKDIYRTLYNHIVGADPTGFESWLRSTPIRDQDQLYFAAYKASFGEANYITYQCSNPKCKKIFMKELPIEAMYEVDKEYQETFEKILNKDTSMSVNIESELVPISDKFAIGIVEPSIYSVDIESIMIDEEMRTKYARIINLLPFIDAIYYIDAENQEFVPVDERPVPNDFAKTTKHRLAIYYNILNTLDNDQMSALSAYTVNFNNKKVPITFAIPECTCPECGSVIPKEEQTASNILFSRAQSALLANLSER